MVLHAGNLSAVGVETGGPLGLSGQPVSLIDELQSNERPVSKGSS